MTSRSSGWRESGRRSSSGTRWNTFRIPGGAIREAARLLRPGGVIVIAVPNTDSLQAQTFGDRWLHLDPPLHLVHLSERALRSRLTACGFEVERVSHVRGGQIVIGWLDGLVGSLPGRPSLYQALRRPEARSGALSAGRRAAALAAGVVLLPLAMGAAALEVGLQAVGDGVRGGAACLRVPSPR